MKKYLVEYAIRNIIICSLFFVKANCYDLRMKKKVKEPW